MDAEDPPGYPRDLVEAALLDDGTRLVFRPIRPDDVARLERLFPRLSPQTLYRRFFTPMTRTTPALLRRLAVVDYVDRLALCALVGDEVVGVARCDRLPSPPAGPAEAEVAVLVEDAWQGRGIATRLLWRLAAWARSQGVAVFVAEVQGENRPMMGLLKVIATEVETRLEDGEYRVRITLERMRG